MSIGSLSRLTNNYIQSPISKQLTNTTSTPGGTNINSASFAQQPDTNNFSPFAQVLSALQQLQQSNPTQYQQVTQDIGNQLESAAQTAAADGNTQAAANLTQLAADFKTASQNGQLPNVQDLAHAIGGGHHHHHHHHVESSSSNPDSGLTTGNTPTSSNSLGQLLSSFFTGSTNSTSLDPSSIILNTLASDGVVQKG